MKNPPETPLLNCLHGFRPLSSLVVLLLAGAVSSTSAQTVRTWTNSTNTQFNNTANWNPTNAWSNNDTLRFNGTVGGALNLYYQGGQNTGVTLDFTAGQTGAVSISLSNEATQSRNASSTCASAVDLRSGLRSPLRETAVAGKWLAHGGPTTSRMKNWLGVLMGKVKFRTSTSPMRLVDTLAGTVTGQAV